MAISKQTMPPIRVPTQFVPFMYTVFDLDMKKPGSRPGILQRHSTGMAFRVRRLLAPTVLFSARLARADQPMPRMRPSLFSAHTAQQPLKDGRRFLAIVEPSLPCRALRTQLGRLLSLAVTALAAQPSMRLDPAALQRAGERLLSLLHQQTL